MLGWVPLLTPYWKTQLFNPRVGTVLNAGVGATHSWYGCVRLAADVIANAPDCVIIDFAVNDSDSLVGDRANGFLPAAEALVRRLRASLPNAMLAVIVFTWPDDYSYLSSARRTARDAWIALANTYGLTLFRWDSWLEGLMGPEYTDPDVEAYFYNPPGSVHPNDAGYQTVADMIEAQMTSISTSGQITPLPDRLYAEAEDYEAEPIIRNGIDNDGETGTGWSTSGTARQSSTADDTIAWTGTFCSFGLDTNYGGGAGTLAWSVDGGAFTNYDLSASGVDNRAFWNFERGVHTVTIKVVSGTVQINRFMAI